MNRYRLEQGVVCSKSVRNLTETFDGFSHSAPEIGIQLTDFTRWNLNDLAEWWKLATNSQKEAFKNVKRSQEIFATSCLNATIPSEMRPTSIKRAVGILSHNGEVKCTALRVSPTKIVTAKHCLFDPLSGKPNNILKSMEGNTSALWFSYEGEPGDRFGVCLDSAKSAYDGEMIQPLSDEIVLSIAQTNTPAPDIEWAPQEVSEGTSLYLRGYFHFIEGDPPPLERLRSSTSACYAHAVGSRCFFHSCQTTPSMSGAPIFIRPPPEDSNQTLKVVGIHLGHAGMSSSEGDFGKVCDSIDGARIPLANFAIAPTPQN